MQLCVLPLSERRLQGSVFNRYRLGIWDFSRVYVPTCGPISSKDFLRALSAGRSYITNGTFLEFQIDNAKIGDTLSITEPSNVKVVARAVGRGDFAKFELVHNGQVIRAAKSRPVANHFEANLDLSVKVREPSWLAVRIPTEGVYNIRSRYTGKGTNVLGKVLFAHTSPIYVEFSGKTIFQPSAAEHLIVDLRKSIATIQAKGVFATDQERAGVLEIYHEATAVLQERLKKHGDSATR